MYPIGSKVWGDRLIKCEVIRIQQNQKTGDFRYRVRCPGGERFISPADIRGHEPPRLIQVGDRVRLKNTDRIYTVQSIYSVRCGKTSEGEPDYESYCKLTTEAGTIATWKSIQLEVIE